MIYSVIAEKADIARSSFAVSVKSLSVISEKSGIRELALHEIIEYAVKYNIDKIFLFGSRARGDYHKTSDIDLAVTGREIVLFSLTVDEETQTLLKYDIISLDRPLPPELKESIEREGVLLYEKIR